MTLQQKLDQMKERMAEEAFRLRSDGPEWMNVPNFNMRQAERQAAFSEGFTAAAQLLLPLVDELLEIARGSDDFHERSRYTDMAVNALSTLERRIEEGGKR